MTGLIWTRGKGNADTPSLDAHLGMGGLTHVWDDIIRYRAIAQNLGCKLPDNYPTLPGNIPNYRDFGWGKGI